jgi:hypothetical protein
MFEGEGERGTYADAVSEVRECWMWWQCGVVVFDVSLYMGGCVNGWEEGCKEGEEGGEMHDWYSVWRNVLDCCIASGCVIKLLICGFRLLIPHIMEATLLLSQSKVEGIAVLVQDIVDYCGAWQPTQPRRGILGSNCG